MEIVTAVRDFELDLVDSLDGQTTHSLGVEGLKVHIKEGDVFRVRNKAISVGTSRVEVRVLKAPGKLLSKFKEDLCEFKDLYEISLYKELIKDTKEFKKVFTPVLELASSKKFQIYLNTINQTKL